MALVKFSAATLLLGLGIMPIGHANEFYQDLGSAQQVADQDPRPAPPTASPKAKTPETPFDGALPVGTWRVGFSNGVTEVCEIRNGGESWVKEPGRGSSGTACVVGGSVVITFVDDRVERWTLVGKRYVVEHWFPGSRLPTATPVLGIADLMR